MSNDLLSYLADKTTQDEIKTNVSNVNTNVNNVKTDLASVKTDVATVNTNISDVKTSVDTINTNANTAATNSVSIKSTVNTINTNVSSILTKVNSSGSDNKVITTGTSNVVTILNTSVGPTNTRYCGKFMMPYDGCITITCTGYKKSSGGVTMSVYKTAMDNGLIERSIGATGTLPDSLSGVSGEQKYGYLSFGTESSTTSTMIYYGKRGDWLSFWSAGNSTGGYITNITVSYSFV